MNHTPLLVIFAVLIAVISVPAYGELITDHVVINEVDTNPFGDDSLAISEWVELYNPTDTDVDLSGWEIASTTVLKKTFTIPDGTVISPEKHLTFTYAKVWFTDSSELIELRNSSGDVIDDVTNQHDDECRHLEKVPEVIKSFVVPIIHKSYNFLLQKL